MVLDRGQNIRRSSSRLGENSQGAVPFVGEQVVRRTNSIREDPESGAAAVVLVAVGVGQLLGCSRQVLHVLEEGTPFQPFALCHRLLRSQIVVNGLSASYGGPLGEETKLQLAYAAGANPQMLRGNFRIQAFLSASPKIQRERDSSKNTVGISYQFAETTAPNPRSFR